MAISGSSLAGVSSSNNRAEDDFYATDPRAVEMLLKEYEIRGTDILEPCVGQGHIANAVSKYYKNEKQITGIDIVDRGYKDIILCDFLWYITDKRYDAIITNPPYSLGKEFVEKSMELLKDGGQMAMFLKIQFLEGIGRKGLFEKYPPKYIYVFRNRMATWTNGEEKDENGKKRVTTMCHAWFIWEKGSTTEPIVRWI